MATLSTQTHNAFEFIDKLFIETSYLVKEVEGQLLEVEEKFHLAQASGYKIRMYTSTGLESANSKQWLPKIVSAYFAPEKSMKEIRKGRTYTPFAKDLKVLVLHIAFYSDEIKEPVVLAGMISDIKCKHSKYSRFEQLLADLRYSGDTVLRTALTFTHDEGICSFKGKLKREKLFSIKGSEDVEKKIVQPMLAFYRRKSK